MRQKSLVLFVTFLTLAAFANEELIRAKQRAQSDDAGAIEEALFHGMARATVIQSVGRNKLGASGSGFRVKRNPVGNGCFVYEAHTNLSGTVSPLVWWVTTNQSAYAVNGPSKLVTPSLKWPREDGLVSPSTHEIVAYVFENVPIPPSAPTQTTADSFTVKDYEIYRAIIDSPASVSETTALQDAGKLHGVSANEAKNSARRVQKVLFQNKWFGTSETEIKHASDWKEER